MMWRSAHMDSSERRKQVGNSVCLAATGPLVLYLVLSSIYQVKLSNAMFIVDFICLAYLFALFLTIQRSPRLAIIPFVLVVTLVFWIAIQKYVVMGLWVRFADISTLDEAWQVLPTAQRIGLLVISAPAIAITIYNVRRPAFRKLGALLVPAAVCAALMVWASGPAIAFLRASTNAKYGNDPLYRSVLFAAGYDLLERFQFEQRTDSYLLNYPTDDFSLWDAEIHDRRNIHIFVLESFMDPTLLTIDLPEDPVDPTLRMAIGGASLSPVFAGQSAQAEFELLCGIPAYSFLDPVTFNELRGELIDCLPAFLHRNGYATLASQDSKPNFFNGRQAYQSVGFSRDQFIDDLPASDLDGIWVSIDQRITHNKEQIIPLLQRGQPILNYMFFTSGHFPYEMNVEKRPLVLETSSTDEVTRFLNAIYHNTRAISRYVTFLTENDPSAIIVVVGDHQGALPSIDRAKEPNYEYDRYLTPYIFIDAGKVRVLGDLAQYELPRLISQSLAGSSFHTVAESHGVQYIRPFNDYAFYRIGSEVRRCPDENDPRCQSIDRFRNQTIADWLRLIQASRPQQRDDENDPLAIAEEAPLKDGAGTQ